MEGGRVLHLVNGESTAIALTAGGLAGEIRSGDDLLMEGPVPIGLATAAAWPARAGALEARFGIPTSTYLAQVEPRERLLASAPQHGGLTLWFEEDLFCQVNFLYLCSRLVSAKAVWLVCPPGVRLGPLPPDLLIGHLAAREPLSEARLAAARAAWRAYCGDDPLALVAVGNQAANAWPGLDRWIALHLARLPSTDNGLNVIERAILRRLVEREQSFADLFRALQGEAEVVDYGLGDLQVARSLLDLALTAEPAVAIAGWDGRSLWDNRDRLSSWRVRATAAGEAYLSGKDYIERNGIDRYLGGIHLSGRSPRWRWDPRTRRPVAG